MGSLISRSLFHDEMKTTLPGMPDGLYLVLRFITRFENKTSAVESVTLTKDENGNWRTTGYFIK